MGMLDDSEEYTGIRISSKQLHTSSIETSHQDSASRDFITVKLTLKNMLQVFQKQGFMHSQNLGDTCDVET
jgi:hypothetical protein